MAVNRHTPDPVFITAFVWGLALWSTLWAGAAALIGWATGWPVETLALVFVVVGLTGLVLSPGIRLRWL